MEIRAWESTKVIATYPLSSQQRRLWSQHGRTTICAQGAVLIEGPFNARALKKSFELVAARHEILRTTYNCHGGSEPLFQTVHDSLDIDWDESDEQEDVAGSQSGVREAELATALRRLASDPFDIEHGPVLRVSLLHIDEQHGLLVVGLPSLSADALTIKNLVVEIEGAYHHLAHCAEPTADSLPYSAYSLWQNELEADEGEDARKVRAYWSMQDLAALSRTGVDTVGTGVDYRPEVYGFDLPPEAADSLSSVAERLDLSRRAILLACWNVVASRLKDHTDIVIGEVFDGRTYEEFQDALGLYARCLPVYSKLQLKQPFSSLARKLQQLQRRAAERQDYAVFDSEVNFPIGFEYNEWPSPQRLGDVSFTLVRQFVCLERFQINLKFILTGSLLRGEFYFDPEVVREDLVRLLGERFLTVLDAALKDPRSLIEDLPTFGVTEQHKILTACSGREANYKREKCLHELCEERARQTPDEVAVICASEMITYAELNARANKLARHLMGKGVRPDLMVGICVERSLEMVVGLLGILKSGGAYVPMDPGYPAERLSMMVEDANVKVMVTGAGLEGKAGGYKGEVVGIDREWEQIASHSDQEVISGVRGDNLAYVIYTSGSTGKPKGVMIRHRSIYNHMLWMQCELPLTCSDRLLQKTAISFDASVWELFMPLITGARLIMAEPRGQQDAAYLVEEINRQRVSILQVVPTMLDLLLAEADLSSCKSLRRVYVGGEALTLTLQTRFSTQLEATLGNLYGPTETTIQVIYWECRRAAAEANVPIGRPIWNTHAYVLDEKMRLNPAEKAGELFIGGMAVGRGYLNRPDLTAERFLPDHFGEAGSRFYTTGDLARLSPDGTIEFIGRIDSQLKIRGFRVELEEIEAVLAEHPDVRKAVVVCGKGTQSKQLIAYVVARQGAEVSHQELRSHLAGRLPEYMIPSAIVLLERFPLMPNGKIDRDALPSPDRLDARAGGQMALPRNAKEEALAEIWADVLRIPAVGIYDNFFELGGDSILVIQVVARSNRIGLVLTPRQVFDKQTIAELAAAAGSGPRLEAEQGWVTGPVPLTPIQMWFFEQGFVDPHHWNQSVMLEVSPALGSGPVEAAVLHVISHHDALRLRFSHSDQGEGQFIADMTGVACCFTVIDLSAVSAPALAMTIEETARQLQAALNMHEGPIARFALLHLGNGRSGRLLIVIHHLAVDGISWRILLEDLERVCDLLLKHEPVELPPKTTSFKQWSRRLTDHAKSGAFAQELPFWLRLESGDFTCLPKDGDGPNLVGSARSVTRSLEREETSILLQELPEAYGTHINDILLTAIARSFAICTGSSSLLIDMEGHGREPIFEDLDISRTVGWFTSKFPLLLDIGGARSSREALKMVKEQLRKVPNNGIGYGLLRYLSEDQQAVKQLQALPNPDIKFNYLGQFDQTLNNAGLFVMSKEDTGPNRDPRCERTHLLDVDAIVLGERLHMRWVYSENVFDHERISSLAAAAADELRTLIAREGIGETGRYSTSDFPLARLDQRSLDRIARTFLPNQDGSEPENWQKRPLIEDIYPVSPLQESFLAHSLSTHGSWVGFEQKSLLLRGSIDLSSFCRTWQELIDRHPVLRTAFAIDSLAGPLQVVLSGVKIPIEQEDWRAMRPSEQEENLDRYLRADRERGFDPASAPLMRVALIRLSEEAYRLVWSHHHLLLDAWCGNLVLEEIFEIYNAALSNRTPELLERRPYRDYIAWLDRQDSSSAEQFWRNVLKGFVTPTRLPIGRRAHFSTARSDEFYKTGLLEFPASETEAIAGFTKSNKLTLNTLLHGAWALLLGRYSQTEDVVFGTTVSGRPPHLPGSESILGMFINNLPVRMRLPGKSEAMASLRELQSTLVGIREYEWVSPLRFMEWSDLARANRLFESLLVFQNYPFERSLQPRLSDLQMEDLRGRIETSYPLTVVVGPFEPLTVRFMYDARRFDHSEITRLTGHLRVLLSGLALGSHSQLLRDVPMLTPVERHQLAYEYYEYKDSTVPGVEKLCVHQLIEEKAARAPGDVAVESGEESLTWSELNVRADRMAHHLAQAGVRPGTILAIILNRGLEFAVGLVAAVKAGGCFIALDRLAPSERISDQLERAGAQAILASKSLYANTQHLKLPVVFAEQRSKAEESEPDLPKSVNIKDLACLHYAPGLQSAVGITHEAIFDQATNFALIASPGDRDVVFVGTTSVADAAVEILQYLAAGVQVAIADDDLLLRPEALIEAIRDSGATIMQARPSTWQHLLKLGWEGGASFKAICPCKRLPTWLARELSARTGCLLKVYTAGGAGRWFTYTSIKGEDYYDSSLIGTPVAGARISLLSGDLQHVPIAVTGEIYIGSTYMELGNRYEIEAVPDRFDSIGRARLFRTGDLGVRRDDGQIEFRGQAGRRVAIKGELVDLYEVESGLLAHPALLDIGVTPWENAEGENFLGAYIVADFYAMPGTEELVAFANTRLPRYAVPDFFVAMDQLPLTSDGDVDFKALPPPDAAGVHVEVIWQEFCDPLQLRVKKIWEDLFGFRPIGIKENFFELGGHSLLGVCLMGEIQKEFGRELPLSTLLEGATVEYFAEVLRVKEEPDSWSPIVQIQEGGGNRVPLFCVHSLGGEVLNYIELAHYLGPDQPVYGLQARGFADGKEGARRLEDMAACYVEAVRKLWPNGPYCLVGYSFGGVLALEMAQQLYARGEPVTCVGPLDTNLLGNLPVDPGSVRVKAGEPFDWAKALLNFSRHGTKVTIDDLRRQGTIEQQVTYAIEHGVLPYNLDLPTALRYMRAGDDINEAKREYVAKPFKGQICLFRALQGQILECPDPTLGWGHVAAGGLEIYEVPGAHWNMLVKPHVQVLASRIRTWLDAAQAQSSGSEFAQYDLEKKSCLKGLALGS